MDNDLTSQEETDVTTETETQDETIVADYTSGSDTKEEIDYKEKFSASTREAQRLASELKAAKEEIDEWVEMVKGNPELQEAVSKVTGKTVGDDRLKKLEEKLEGLEKKSREQTLKSFESDKRTKGFTFTPEIRKQIGSIVKDLEKVMSYEEALEVAYIRFNKDGIAKSASESGRNQALAQSKTNQDATYSTSNSSHTESKNHKLPADVQAYVDSMRDEADKKRFTDYYLANNK